MPVPANIGLSEADRLEAPVHTHDATGVIHLEAARPSDAFTLGTVLTLWGVRFTASELGGYQTGGGSALKVYVNGTETPNGPAVQLREHDDIVLAFGVPGSSPTTSPYRWPEEK